MQALKQKKAEKNLIFRWDIPGAFFKNLVILYRAYNHFNIQVTPLWVHYFKVKNHLKGLVLFPRKMRQYAY